MRDSKNRRTALQVLRDWWRRICRKPQPPLDPYAERLVPVRRGPKGRSGAGRRRARGRLLQGIPAARNVTVVSSFSVPPCLCGEIMLQP
jgi:hypothetical protein